ncbi:MAG TPA: hypothetical protein VFV34_09950 [Blastocatellia bacterium]|nr:hypothetical protein [Blastocatellia bacterium]
MADLRFKLAEPEHYTARVRAVVESSGQPAYSLEYVLAKMGADRRAVFPVKGGEGVYIERSGLRYVVFEGRKLYAEISPEASRLRVDALVRPIGLIEQPHLRTSYEKTGSEEIAGRKVTTVRFVTETPAGTRSAQGLVHLDDFTSAPIHIELALGSDQASLLRITYDLSDVSLHSDARGFEVPIGFKKVGAQSVPLEGLVTLVAPFAAIKVQPSR